METTTPTGVIGRINQTSMDRLRFRDFLRLKVRGRDQFSRLRTSQLIEAVGPEVYSAIAAAIENEKYRDSCCRWVLRGLSTDKAIRKVKTDIEVGENARGSDNRRFMDDRDIVQEMKDELD